MTDLKTRLQIKDDMQGLILNRPRGLGLPVRHNSKGQDFALIFVQSQADIETHAEIVNALKPDALVWFCYPKLSGSIPTGISRDRGWEPVYRMGYRGVRQIAIDETWSALRFRDASLVKSRK